MFKKSDKILNMFSIGMEYIKQIRLVEMKATIIERKIYWLRLTANQGLPKKKKMNYHEDVVIETNLKLITESRK